MQILPAVTGQSARGTWERQTVVFEQPNKQYGKEIAVTFMNKGQEVANLRVGETYLVSFDIESRNYQGKWYTDVRAWRVQPVQSAAAAASCGRHKAQPAAAVASCGRHKVRSAASAALCGRHKVQSEPAATSCGRHKVRSAACGGVVWSPQSAASDLRRRCVVATYRQRPLPSSFRSSFLGSTYLYFSYYIPYIYTRVRRGAVSSRGCR